MGGERFILEQIKILSKEVVKIGEKIKDNEHSRQASISENVELKKMLARLEYSILDLGGNVSDANISVEGNNKTQCTESCSLL